MRDKPIIHPDRIIGDTLEGTSNIDNVIYGYFGNDTLEGGFGNDILKDMIIRSVGRLAAVSLSSGICLNDGQLDSEIVEGCTKHNGSHAELAHLAATGALDVQNQKHLKMVEAWLSAR